MAVSFNKILLSLSIILLITLFIGTHASNVASPDSLVQSNVDHRSPESVHDMAKRRFLPTRRELHQYINDKNVENPIHLTAKRYFLKTKRYFLNTKRDNERREEEDEK